MAVPAQDPPRALDRLVAEALAHDGVFTYEEALRRGISVWALNRAVKRGTIVRLLPRVYVVAGAGQTWWRDARAVAYWSAGALSHRSAAYALGLLESPSYPIHVTRRSRRAPTGSIPVRVHVCSDLVEAELTRVRGIQVTHAARTILDIADEIGEEELETVLESALRANLVRIARLRWQLQKEGRRGRPGTAALRRLLEQRVASLSPTDSVLEDKVWRWFRGTKLPLPVRQLRVHDRGGHVARVDFAYPEHKLAIEALSYAWHSGRQEWVKDQTRDRRLRRLGWRIVYVIKEDVDERGPELELEIARHLGLALF